MGLLVVIGAARLGSAYMHRLYVFAEVRYFQEGLQGAHFAVTVDCQGRGIAEPAEEATISIGWVDRGSVITVQAVVGSTVSSTLEYRLIIDGRRGQKYEPVGEKGNPEPVGGTGPRAPRSEHETIPGDHLGAIREQWVAHRSFTAAGQPLERSACVVPTLRGPSPPLLEFHHKSSSVEGATAALFTDVDVAEMIGRWLLIAGAVVTLVIGVFQEALKKIRRGYVPQSLALVFSALVVGAGTAVASLNVPVIRAGLPDVIMLLGACLGVYFLRDKLASFAETAAKQLRLLGDRSNALGRGGD